MSIRKQQILRPGRQTRVRQSNVNTARTTGNAARRSEKTLVGDKVR